MASSADIQAQIDSLNDKISNLSSGMGGAGVRTTYQNQIRNLQTQLNAARQAEERQQQEQQFQQQNDQRQQDEQRQREEQQRQQDEQRQREAQQLQQQQQQQSATPISEVAPQAAGNQLPTLKQSIIDEQFKNKRTNELTSFNSDIRDKIVDAGWNEKSDAVRVLNGAGVYGIVAAPASMGSIGYKKLNGGAAGEQDFIDAAKVAGIDPNQYMNSETIYGKTSKTLDQTKLYNALQEKGKDLYSVTNSLSGAGGRGDATPHATVLYKADGSGNLVVQNNPTTGQPDVKYFEAVRYAKPESFMDTYGPFLALAPAFGGILQSAGVIPTFGSATGTAAGSGAFPAGAGGYGSIGPAGFTASAAAPLTAGLTAEQIAQRVGSIPTNIANGGGYNVAGGAASAAGGAALPAGVTNPASFAALNEAIGLGTSPAGVLGPGVAATIGANSLGSLIGNAAGGTAAQNALSAAFGNSGLFNALGAGGQAIGSYLSGQAQADAAKEAARNQMSMFNTINQQFAPQRGAGYQSLNQIRSMLPGQSMTYNEAGQPSGVQTGTDYLTRQFSPQDLQAGLAPNYQFMLGQGQQAQQRAANVGGGLIGGNALRGLEDYTQNYAQNAYQNAFQNFNQQRTGIYNTLAGIAGLGQQAQNTTAQAGQAATTAQGQLGIGAAAAQAAGLTGAANAAQGGLQNYQQNQILQAVLGQNQNVAQTQTPGYFG
jgi:hypothetical protein